MMLHAVRHVLPYGIGRRFRILKRKILIARFKSASLDGAYRAISASLDHEQVTRLWREVQPAFQLDAAGGAKWADWELWLPLSVYRAAALGLHRTTQMRILDLGCGPAYFISVARQLGHDCQGVDLPGHLQTPIEKQVFSKLTDALECRPFVSDLAIQKCEPMPISGQYDLITAFWVCFNRHKQPDEWTAPEWRYFAADVARFLRPGGRLYLELNENKRLSGKSRWYDDEMAEFFRRFGTIDQNKVTLYGDALRALTPLVGSQQSGGR